MSMLTCIVNLKVAFQLDLSHSTKIIDKKVIDPRAFHSSLAPGKLPV